MSNSSPNKPVKTINDELIVYLHPDYVAGQPVNFLEKLWAQVQANDISSFEAIHKILYPVLFKYGHFLIKDSQLTDAVAEEVFVRFWVRRKSITGKKLKIEMLKAIRKELLNHLPEVAIDNHWLPDHEVFFLMYSLEIEYEEILEITLVDNHSFFNG